MNTPQFAALLLKFNDEAGTSSEVFKNFYNEEIGRPFRERMEHGLIRGEFGSPILNDRMSASDRISRAGQVNELSVCLTVNSMEIREDGIYGQIVPSGPLGGAMVDHLAAHPDKMIVLSMRHFSRKEAGVQEGTFRTTKIQQIIAFDLINDFVE